MPEQILLVGCQRLLLGFVAITTAALPIMSAGMADLVAQLQLFASGRTIITQIAAFRAVLASTSSDPNLDKLKSYDLSWLLHLVGDVHQPLHSTTRVSTTKPDGDDGGNGVKLTSPANLHTFWDDVLGVEIIPRPR